jgi:CDP-4-dehydro-6-deoxyglucose reductase
MSAYRIDVQPAGRSFTAEKGETVLEAGLRAGVLMPHACRNGACGACKGRVHAGQFEQGPHSEGALSHEERAAGLALFCCARPLSDLAVEVRLPSTPDGIVPRRMPARIEQVRWLASDVVLMGLRLPEGEELLFRAGQYVDFILANGVRRSYSIASLPGAGGLLEFHIRHMPGGIFTDALFAAQNPGVREKSIVRIEGPLGSFCLQEAQASGPIVLLASGTGFAPLQAIAQTLFERGLNRGDGARQVLMYWGGRTRSDLYLDEVPRAWAAEQPNFRYIPVISDTAADAAAHAGAPPWEGRTGLVHTAVMQDLPDLSSCEVYACGAPAMVAAAQADFVAQCRLPATHFYADAFLSRADAPRAGA